MAVRVIKKMKNDELVEKICKPFCSFYKEGKEEMLCRGAEIFRKIFNNSQNERFLAYFNEEISCPKVFYQNDEMLKKICRKCEFYITGCDFTDPDFKGYSPPCGGYIAVVCLIKEKNITLQALLDAEEQCGS